LTVLGLKLEIFEDDEDDLRLGRRLVGVERLIEERELILNGDSIEEFLLIKRDEDRGELVLEES
jgi:hypothetical protein